MALMALYPQVWEGDGAEFTPEDSDYEGGTMRFTAAIGRIAVVAILLYAMG